MFESANGILCQLDWSVGTVSPVNSQRVLSGLKTNLSLSPSCSAHKLSHHKFSKFYNTNLYKTKHTYTNIKQNFRRSPFGIAPVKKRKGKKKKRHRVRTRWYGGGGVCPIWCWWAAHDVVSMQCQERCIVARSLFHMELVYSRRFLQSILESVDFFFFFLSWEVVPPGQLKTSCDAKNVIVSLAVVPT